MTIIAKRLPYFIDSVNLVKLGEPLDPQNPLKGLVDKETGAFVNNAVAIIDHIRDEDGDEITWASTSPMPLTMTYKPGSGGVYTGKIPVGANVVVGQQIELGILVSVSSIPVRRFWVAYYGELG